MLSHIIVANLLQLEDEQPSIRFVELDVRSAQYNHDDNLFVGYYTLGNNGNVQALDGTLSYEKHSKAMSKCKLAANILMRFLNSRLPCKEIHGEHGRPAEDQLQSSAVIGDTAIITDEAFSETHEIHSHSWNIFLSTHMRFPTAFSRGVFESTQYLQVSCPTLKIDDTLFTQQGNCVYDHIDIVSGICLFNGNILKASVSGPLGREVDPSVLRAKPSIHEMEYIARSSTAIADIAALLLSRTRERCSKIRVTINLDIPSFHYYHSAIDMFEKGLCSSFTALDWMDTVDLRHDQIAEVFTGYLQHELHQRGVPDAYEIHVSPKSNLVAYEIREAVRHERCPSVDEVLQYLNDEDDGLWRRFYPHVPARERPRSWEDLGYLFYVFEVVRSALVEQIDSETGNNLSLTTTTATPRLTDNLNFKPKPRRLIFSIDDAAERRIYSKAQEIVRKIRSSASAVTTPVLMEVYLCRKVFVNGNRSRARLYHHEPVSQAFVDGRSLVGEDGRVVRSLDVVRRIHGAEATRVIHSLVVGASL